MKGFVLDASAILAYLNDESGKEFVAPSLYAGIINAVNVAEVVSKLRDEGLSEQEAEFEISGILSQGCKVSAFGHDLAVATGHLKTMTRLKSLSLGDRACLALGMQLGLPILTADRLWSQLDPELFIIVQIR
jgi:PIN domain nuclease of toxin-antitoxin system